MAGQGGRVTVPETNNQRARCGRLFRRDPWAHRPSRPGGAKGPEQPGKKREGEREGGTGKRGPRTEARRDHEPSECGASDTPHPRLVAEPPGINGASANGLLERVTLCRR